MRPLRGHEKGDPTEGPLTTSSGQERKVRYRPFPIVQTASARLAFHLGSSRPEGKNHGILSLLWSLGASMERWAEGWPQACAKTEGGVGDPLLARTGRACSRPCAF